MAVQHAHNRRVVVTGIGAITPLGKDAESTWRRLQEGQSGIGRITHFDTEGFDTSIAAQVDDFEPRDYLDVKEARRMDRFCQFAMAASQAAVDDAKLDTDTIDADRVGVVIASGIGGMATWESEARKLFERGPRRISPFFIPMLISDIAPGQVSMRFGFRGPNYTTTSACASSANALADALNLIRLGDADVMVAGGSEATITPMGIAGFNAMKALSTRNDAPDKASRPFDAGRDGFVMGEGGGVLILEALEHAQKRGAKIYAEFTGAGLSADAYHLTAPVPDGNGARRAMQAAMRNSGMRPEDVDYINAHGTSTQANDKIETQAIADAFGEHAKSLSISSSKSMLGHLLGASGAVEAVASILSIRDGVVHPTANQEEADPECYLNYTPNTAQRREVRAAMSNSFGFGGHNVSLVFRRFEEQAHQPAQGETKNCVRG